MPAAESGKIQSDTYKVVRPLPVKKTRDDLFKLAQEAANLASQCDGLQLEAKSIADSYKGRMNEIADRIRTIHRIVRDEAETMDVPCVVMLDYKHGKATVTREDTGEVVTERSLTPAECQMEIDRSAPPGSSTAPGKKVEGKAKPKGKGNK